LWVDSSCLEGEEQHHHWFEGGVKKLAAEKQTIGEELTQLWPLKQHVS